MASKFDIKPFLGLSTSLDSRLIPQPSAADMRNVTVDDGALRPRKGFKKLSDSFANQNGPVSGFDYVSGYDSNSAFVDEYISVERSSVGPNNSFPISRNAATGAYTGQIKNGSTSIPFSSSDWRAFGFRDRAYVYCPDNTPSAYRHTIGDLTSLVPLATPATPDNNNLTYSITYGANDYTKVNWTSLNVSTNITYTGAATSTNSSVASSELLVIGHNTTNVASSVTIDLNGATQAISDWTSNDIFGVEFRTVATSTTWRMVPDTVRMTLINNDGSPVSFTPVETTYNNIGDTNTMILGLRFRFDKNTSTRALWDNVRKIKFDYTTATASGTATNNKVSIKVWIGGVEIVRTTGTNAELFNCTFFDSTNLYESAMDSTPLAIPATALQGAAVLPNLRGLGTQVTLTYTGFASGTNYDRVRFYMAGEPTGVGQNFHWHLLNTSSTGSWLHKISYAEVVLLAEYAGAPVPFASIVSGCAYKSWVVWGFKGTAQNIRHSTVGNAEKLASAEDPLDDETRGANFSLTGDESLSMHESGDVLVITGSSGVYAQTGDAPTRMTPPQKVPGTRGAAGKWASAVWRDDTGQAGVVFVDRAGEGVWFVQVTNGFFGDRSGGYLVQELSKGIRGFVRSFLFDGQSITDTSKVRVAVDEATDSLLIVVNNRALRLGRPNALSGAREWEAHVFTLGTNESIAFVSGSPRRRLRWIRQSASVSQNSGQIDDVFWDSVGNAWIEGTNRDGGNAMTSIYWKSKTFAYDQTARVNHVLVERQSYSNTPSITCASTRQTATKTLASGKYHTRFGALQSGREHQFTITMSEGDGAIYRLQVELFGPDSDREQS